MEGEWETLEHSILSGMFSTNLSSQDSRKYADDDLERLLVPEEMDNTKETEPSRCHEANVHMNSQSLRQHS